MKITQEVREFAASAANGGRPGDGRTLELAERSEAGEEDFAAKQSSPRLLGEGDHVKHGGGAASAAAEAEKGMAEMSEKFREKGGEIYLPAAE